MQENTKIQLMRFHEAFYFTNPDIKKHERIKLFLAVSCSFACPIREKNCIARRFLVGFISFVITLHFSRYMSEYLHCAAV